MLPFVRKNSGQCSAPECANVMVCTDYPIAHVLLSTDAGMRVAESTGLPPNNALIVHYDLPTRKVITSLKAFCACMGSPDRMHHQNRAPAGFIELHRPCIMQPSRVPETRLMWGFIMQLLGICTHEISSFVQPVSLFVWLCRRRMSSAWDCLQGQQR